MATTQYSGTLSSGGKVTSTANQEIIFNSPNAPSTSQSQMTVTNLLIDAFDTQLHVKLNDEQTVHEIDPYTSMAWEDIVITKFLIVENGAEFRWTAMFGI